VQVEGDGQSLIIDGGSGIKYLSNQNIDHQTKAT
jgi:hypothetical protein